ncbi:MAG: hypothetical protein M3R27_02790 [Bacteroidota bacterium]|nr:hypothetical protein [Bacteroidota bacterium]
MKTRESDTNKGEQSSSPVPFEIPAQGSLGLLALGAVGIKAWREKRDGKKTSEQNSDKNG